MPLHDVPGQVTALAMRSDGKSLAVGSQFGSIASISLVPLGEGEQQEPWVLQGTHVHALAFSPDGTRLAVGLEDGRVQLWEVAAKAVVEELRCGEEPVHFLEFSPNGEGLVAASGDSLQLWRLEDGEVLFTPGEDLSTCASAVFPPEGGLLLASALGSQVRLRVLSPGEDD
jgi:WD40 repeat protein